jgi:nucleoside-triphosphatase
MVGKRIYGHIRLLVSLCVKALEKRVLILTGSPGTGKTTVLEKTVSALKALGINVGGMISREVRENGIRVGFQIQDVASGKRGWLARANLKTGPQVGNYRVDLGDLDGLGAQAICDALDDADVVVIDEIGPMELYSARFKAATAKTLDSTKLVIAVVHMKAQDRMIVQAKSRVDAEIFVVTEENREVLPEALTAKAVDFLRREPS